MMRSATPLIRRGYGGECHGLLGSRWQDIDQCAMLIVLSPGTFIPFTSARTHETLLNASRLEYAILVYGNARPDRYDVGLAGENVRIEGTLWQGVGPAISFGGDSFRLHTSMLI